MIRRNDHSTISLVMRIFLVSEAVRNEIHFEDSGAVWALIFLIYFDPWGAIGDLPIRGALIFQIFSPKNDDKKPNKNPLRIVPHHLTYKRPYLSHSLTFFSIPHFQFGRSMGKTSPSKSKREQNQEPSSKSQKKAERTVQRQEICLLPWMQKCPPHHSIQKSYK